MFLETDHIGLRYLSCLISWLTTTAVDRPLMVSPAGGRQPTGVNVSSNN